MSEIKLVLDSNEYVFYFDGKSNLLPKLMEFRNIKLFISNLIFREVIRNLREDTIKKFIVLLKNPKFAAGGELTPEHLIEKYEKLGLKKGDIEIAAFCENISADYLVTENRHFLKSLKFDKFKVASIKEFLQNLGRR